MAKAQTEPPSQKPISSQNPQIKHKPLNLNNKRPKLDPSTNNPNPLGDVASDSDSDLSTLLQPYSKDQLIDLISSAALTNPSLRSILRRHADRDVSHRKIFVHGFPWDTSRENLLSPFQCFGEIEDCNVVTDKVTGKAKGYGFVLFKKRKAAAKALKEPQKIINGRIASCQLASVGPVNAGKDQEVVGARKIYVANVPAGADRERLRAFFSKFGEIENGPIGFDSVTGRSKGYALFVYKTVEGAKRSLQEPHKMFDGHILLCSKAADGKSKSYNNQLQGKQQQVVGKTVQQQQLPQGQMLTAAQQNLSLFGHHSGLNSLYNGLLNAGLINPIPEGGVSQSIVPTNQLGGLGLDSQSALGGYMTGQGLQHVYPNSQIGQGGGMGKGRGTGGSFAGYSSYMWA